MLLCLLLSAGIWLIHNLSQTYSDLVGVSVVAISNIDGRATEPAAPVSVLMKCRASGFALMRISARKKPSRITVDASDFIHDDGDFYRLPTASLYKHSAEMVGESVTIEDFLAESVIFSYAAESCRQVPVRAVKRITFKPQYTAVREMTLLPDSVYVYGDPDRIASIDYVSTRPVSLSDVKSNVNGVVNLESIAGVRLSTPQVAYSVEVSRFVEIAADVRIGVRNVPAGIAFFASPSRARAVFKCSFPTRSQPQETGEFYVDYKDFVQSLSGTCVIKADGLPEDVLDWSITPEVCQCLVRE